MDSQPTLQYTRDTRFLLTVYFLFYFSVFAFQGIDSRLLAQVRPALFHYNRDLGELALIGLGLPGFMIAHPVTFLLADILIFLLPVALLGYYRRTGRFSTALGLAFTLYLTLYLLLADIFWQVHHGPFIIYALVSLAFLTNREDRFYLVLKGCRYYFLYIFVSAAIWKIVRGAAVRPEEMSRILMLQHGDLLSGDCLSAACRLYAWLIDHPAVAQGIYLAAVAVEAVFAIGFFTRRYDRLLLALAVSFVAADLLVMRIPYWSVLIGGVTLWMDLDRRRRIMVIYETTHHENLPALLDLGESRFDQVIVFLKAISWQNVSGKDSLAGRWPKTEFIVQPADCSNRAFIHRLFTCLRRRNCSHLHVSTLDNNLLPFTLRLFLADSVQASLTVHEVNDYFARSFGSARDMTETVAKFLLRRRIRRYSFFLPAMAERFRQRMPSAITEFIPSRFYQPQPRARPDRTNADTLEPVRAIGDSPSAGKAFTIVIPGSVDPVRRDYGLVAGIIATLPKTRPIELVLLGDGGTLPAKPIITRLLSLQSGSFRLRHFMGYIPETTYEQELARADLIWSPLHVHKKGSRGVPETYGQTTASGLTADLLLVSIPALTPRELDLPAPFRAALLSYASPGEAGHILDRLSTDPDWLPQLRRDIDRAFAFFVKENFLAAFDRLTLLHEPAEKRRADPV
jgi:hypothetical protein